ncbi:unnamed protein product [Protopolystoma xenopodis]|uniref:Uncharacterized protein n=1 Tax=Protopolystoma xenopodis TaxID=117903 RepID=A0A3S5A020_9PLAT|nr:unnamed protein product [Protopolystoma xenopodis]
MADDFGLGAFYIFPLTIGPSCDNEVNPLLERLVRFHRNRRRLPRKQRQHECSSKANRQLAKRNPPSSSGGIDLQTSSTNASTRNGIRALNRISLTQSRSACRDGYCFFELTRRIAPIEDELFNKLEMAEASFEADVLVDDLL